jgi:hypothetical protein
LEPTGSTIFFQTPLVLSKLGLVDLFERGSATKEGWTNFTEISRKHYNTSVPRRGPSKLPSLNGEVSQSFFFVKQVRAFWWSAENGR